MRNPRYFSLAGGIQKKEAELAQEQEQHRELRQHLAEHAAAMHEKEEELAQERELHREVRQHLEEHAALIQEKTAELAQEREQHRNELRLQQADHIGVIQKKEAELAQEQEQHRASRQHLDATLALVRNAIRRISQVWMAAVISIAVVFVVATCALLIPLVGWQIALVAAVVVAVVCYMRPDLFMKFAWWMLKKLLHALTVLVTWVMRWLGPWPIVIAIVVMLMTVRAVITSPESAAGVCSRVRVWGGTAVCLPIHPRNPRERLQRSARVV